MSKTNKKIDILHINKWEAPEKIDEPDARIITMPNIPLPLHTVNPRNLLGAQTWDRMRRRCYYEAGYKCEACGAEVGKDIDKKDYHCLERGTEVLTTQGWKKIESVTTEDEVAGFYPETETIVWEHPTSTTSHYTKKIYRFCRKNGRGFSVGVSGKHRMLIQDGKTKKYKVVRAEDLSVGRWENIPSAGRGVGEGHLTADERLLIALQADGSVRKKENCCYCQIRVKKRYKIKRLKNLAEQSSYKIHQSTYYTKKHGEYFRLFFVIPYEGKRFFDTFHSPKMPYTKAVEFIDELVKWDGWEGFRGKQYGRCYYSSNKDDIDFVQAVCAQAGLGSHFTISHRKARDFGDHISDALKPAYNLEIKKTASHGLQTMVKQEEEYDDDVFCISVPSTYFVARTKTGDVFITGNSHELYSIDYIAGESRFIRCVGLCAKCHLLSIHSGRMYTMFKRGNPMMPASKVIDGAEHTFSLVNRWELQHPGEELRLFATWVEMARDKVIGEEITALIEKYNVRFYGAPKNGASWGEWKLILGGREYPSPFKDEADWREKMEEMNKADKTSDRNVEDPFKGGIFDAIKEELKKS